MEGDPPGFEVAVMGFGCGAFAVARPLEQADPTTKPSAATTTRWRSHNMALPAGADSGSTAGMGKVDDMRRLREAQHEQGQRAAAARGAVPPTVDIKVAVAAGRLSVAAVTTPPGHVDPVEDALVPSQAPWKPSPKTPARPVAGKGNAADETGTCSGCGKPKPMQRGVIGSHQKGLGKMCPGSRKPPA